MPRLVHVHPGGEGDLVRAGVAVVLLGQAEDGVGRKRREAGEDGHGPMVAARSVRRGRGQVSGRYRGSVVGCAACRHPPAVPPPGGERLAAPPPSGHAATRLAMPPPGGGVPRRAATPAAVPPPQRPCLAVPAGRIALISGGRIVCGAPGHGHRAVLHPGSGAPRAQDHEQAARARCRRAPRALALPLMSASRREPSPAASATWPDVAHRDATRRLPARCRRGPPYRHEPPIPWSSVALVRH